MKGSGGAPLAITDDTVLEIDLAEALDEAGDGPAGFFGESERTLQAVLFALDAARDDPQVKAVFLRAGGTMPLATAQELADGLKRFKSGGKKVFAWAETFGEGTPSVSGYMVAAVADEVWLQPSGEIGLSGFFGETMFLRGAFDKAAVVPSFVGRKEYKNAVNQYTETTFTAPHKEAMLALMQSFEAQVVASIVATRPQLGDAAAVTRLLHDGPYGADAALKAGIIDKVGYFDEVMDAVGAHVGGKPHFLWAHRYLAKRGSPLDAGSSETGPAVAVIFCSGTVTRGSSSVDPLSGGQSFGSRTIVNAIRAAEEDANIKVILLRVDSPGGSYVASDSIWRALHHAQAAGKKVVVSMGDLAASGGYFVSMGADRVFALGGTITGSIGVFTGKFVTAGLWEKLGVNFETLATADDVDPSMYTSDTDFSPAAHAKVDAMVDRIYMDFVGKAAAGRKVTVDVLEPLAHGRVWSGVDAHQRGLIDALGGFLDAVAYAKELAGPNAVLTTLPKKRAPLEQVLGYLRGSDEDNSETAHVQLAVQPAGLVRALREQELRSRAESVRAELPNAPRMP